MALKLQHVAIFKWIIFQFSAIAVTALSAIPIFFTIGSASAAELLDQLPDSTRQLAASSSSQAIISSISEITPGRYRIIGTVVDSKNQPACGLALASGKCVFSCGSGSPRCEGGVDSLPFGQFDLSNLPTEPNGTINMQTFVSGSMPGLQVINPKGGNNTYYTLTVTSTGTGTGNVTGGGNYLPGEAISLGAYPSNGSVFQGWSPSPCASSFNMPAYNLNCNATFTAGDIIEIPNFSSPASGVAGGQINISLTIKNVSGQSLNFTAGFFLSKNAYTVTPSGRIANCDFSLAPGESSTCAGPITIPSATAPGNYYLIAYVQDNWESKVNPITIQGGGRY